MPHRIATSSNRTSSSIFHALLACTALVTSINALAATYAYDAIPQMTSNTSPSGIASANSSWSSAYEAWKAFDNTTDNYSEWHTLNGSTGWLAYEFPQPKAIGRYTIEPNHFNDVSYAPRNWTFEGWTGSAWVVLDTRSAVTGWAWYQKKTFDIPNTTAYKKYRLNVSANGGAAWLSLGEMEMMEVKPSCVDAIPAMTSNTSPSGIASVNNSWSAAYDAWKAFDNTTDNYSQWHTSTGATGWLAYEFAQARTINGYTIEPNHYNSTNYAPRNWTFEGWNGTSWVVLDTRNGIGGWAWYQKQSFNFNNATAYIKYRLNISANNGANYLSIGEMEMKAAGSCVDSVPTMTSNTSPSGIAKASDSWSSAYEAWKAFDNTSENYSQWHTINGPTGWLEYDFGSLRTIRRYTIEPNHYNSTNYAPRNWTFEGWNGSAWVVLDTRSNVGGWAWYQKQSFDIANTSAYQKYRINVTANGGAGWLSIAELELME